MILYKHLRGRVRKGERPSQRVWHFHTSRSPTWLSRPFLGKLAYSKTCAEWLFPESSAVWSTGNLQSSPQCTTLSSICLLLLLWLSAVFLWCPRSGSIRMFLNGVTRNSLLHNKVFEMGLSQGLLCSPPPLTRTLLPHPPPFTPDVPRCPAVPHSLFYVVISVLQVWGIWAWNSSVRYMLLSACYQCPDLLCKQFW